MGDTSSTGASNLAVAQLATVTLIGGTCLGVDEDTVAVWPHGWRLERSGGAVRVWAPDGLRVGAGDRIQSGPGDLVDVSGADLPAACQGKDGVVLLQPSLR